MQTEAQNAARPPPRPFRRRTRAGRAEVQTGTRQQEVCVGNVALPRGGCRGVVQETATGARRVLRDGAGSKGRGAAARKAGVPQGRARGVNRSAAAQGCRPFCKKARRKNYKVPRRGQASRMAKNLGANHITPQNPGKFQQQWAVSVPRVLQACAAASGARPATKALRRGLAAFLQKGLAKKLPTRRGGKRFTPHGVFYR